MIDKNLRKIWLLLADEGKIKPKKEFQKLTNNIQQTTWIGSPSSYFSNITCFSGLNKLHPSFCSSFIF